SRPHWDGCREGTLRVQRCRDCQTLVFIPQPCCGNCLSERLEWVDSSGRGTIYSYTTVYRPQQPVFETPYTVVIVELEEGWHMLSNLLGVAPDDVRIGAEVEVDFHAMSDEITLPYFKLRSAS
ncbi:MAG TPA: Zn-ribbon domain-containing OB-fold protein, partial [Myxococcota bacterium]|nr:Zn-ribbon domain-containing OB-fold protein [Myxococcota bacterium]